MTIRWEQKRARLLEQAQRQNARRPPKKTMDAPYATIQRRHESKRNPYLSIDDEEELRAVSVEALARTMRFMETFDTLDVKERFPQVHPYHLNTLLSRAVKAGLLVRLRKTVYAPTGKARELAARPSVPEYAPDFCRRFDPAGETA